MPCYPPATKPQTTEISRSPMYQNANGALIQIHHIERRAGPATREPNQQHAVHSIGYPTKSTLGNMSAIRDAVTKGCVTQRLARAVHNQNIELALSIRISHTIPLWSVVPTRAPYTRRHFRRR